MPGTGRLDELYAELLKDHPEGHALYKKCSGRDVKPGSCGYFDADGDWNSIVELHGKNRDALAANGWTDLTGVTVSEDPGFVRWGPKTSRNVHGVQVKVELGVNVPSAPVGGGIEMSYKSSSSAGAVLVTEPPVKHHLAKPSSRLLDWGSQNVRKIVSDHPDTKRRGFWIVTKTYTVKRCAVAVLASQDSEVRFGLDLQAASIGTIAPSAEWWRKGSNDAWAVHEDKSGVVVFMCGIYFRPSRVYKGQLKPEIAKEKQKIYLGSDNMTDLALIKLAQPGTGSQSGDSETIEFRMEFVGQDDVQSELEEFVEQEHPAYVFEDTEDIE